ncbi:MAG: hypothetical protein R3B90_13770 [Planctomycetaceae bacterium]
MPQPLGNGEPGRRAERRLTADCDERHRTRPLPSNPHALDRYLRREERPDFRPFDFVPKAEPAPLGTYTHMWHTAQIEAAAASFFVVSRHEWFDHGDELGPEGLRHVIQLADELGRRRETVVVEAAEVELGYQLTLAEATEAADDLNRRRRDRVAVALLNAGLVDAEERVIVSPIDRVGVRGAEAQRVYNQQFFGGFGGTRGGFGGGGQGGRGGFGGGGLGGGGGGFF